MGRLNSKSSSDNAILREAAAKAGSRSKLARRLRVQPTHLGLWIRRELRPTDRMIRLRQFDFEDVVSELIGRPVTVCQIFPEVFSRDEGEEEASSHALTPPAGADPLESYFISERAQAIDRALERLTPNQEKVIVLRFGLRGAGVHTLEEIAEMWNVGRGRILQIEGRAMKKLRDKKMLPLLSPFIPGEESKLPWWKSAPPRASSADPAPEPTPATPSHAPVDDFSSFFPSEAARDYMAGLLNEMGLTAEIIRDAAGTVSHLRFRPDKGRRIEPHSSPQVP